MAPGPGLESFRVYPSQLNDLQRLPAKGRESVLLIDGQRIIIITNNGAVT